MEDDGEPISLSCFVLLKVHFLMGQEEISKTIFSVNNRIRL